MQILWFTYSYGNIFISHTGKIWYNVTSFITSLGRHPSPYIVKRINLNEHYEENEEIIPRYGVDLEQEVFNLCDNFTLEAFNKLWSKAIDA